MPKTESAALKWAKWIAKCTQNRIEALCVLKSKKNHERKVVTWFELSKATIALSIVGPTVDDRRAALVKNEDMQAAQKELDKVYAETRAAQLQVDTWTAVTYIVRELNALVVAGMLTPDEALGLADSGTPELAAPVVSAPATTSETTAKPKEPDKGVRWIDEELEKAKKEGVKSTTPA